MPKFQIANTVSGLVLGIYEGEDEAAALDALSRDAGYASHAAARAALDVAPDDDGGVVAIRVF